MSRYYCLHCVTCNESSEDFNKADDELIAAAKSAPLVAALVATAPVWDVCSMETEGCRRVGGFVAAHAKCDAFEVRSEYGDTVRVKVEPPAVIDAATVAVHEQRTANAIAEWLRGYGVVFFGVADLIRKGGWR